MNPPRTVYKVPWYPPVFRELSVNTRRTPAMGTGGAGGPPNLIGKITVLTAQRGAIMEGDAVRFVAVQDGGSAPLSYSWSGPAGPIAGATGPTLTVTVDLTSTGTYTVTVTSPAATDSPQSAGVAITVSTRRIQSEASGFILDESNNFILQEF